jgi:hypothetical protein
MTLLSSVDACGAWIHQPLSAAAAKDSHGMEEVVGEYTVLCLFSKNWVLRDAALQKVPPPSCTGSTCCLKLAG